MIKIAQKNILFILFALVTLTAQPVTRKTLEKAHTVTGIVSAIGKPTTAMISYNINKNYGYELVAAFDSRDNNRITNAERAAANIIVKSVSIKLATGLFKDAHHIIGSALEKDDALIVRLMTYFMQILNAKTPKPENIQEALNDFNAAPLFDLAQRRRLGRRATQLEIDYLVTKENAFQSCSSEEAKAIAIEIVAAITYEIARFGLYKTVATNLPGPDTRISRRAIRTIAHTLIIGLLELAKQKAADQWSPDSAHIYTPAKTTVRILLGMLITEICGEILCSQIEEIAEEVTENSVTEQVAPQVN